MAAAIGQGGNGSPFVWPVGFGLQDRSRVGHPAAGSFRLGLGLCLKLGTLAFRSIQPKKKAKD
ncbi:hypothetical protein NC99_39810 [Sunxiuqinia dokdonensis]|uniref:Uncharacterized protein n=1 Tax=Sunxiuqinia dokdonensis TaxID=1409788 RepID=A0A0L8V457_9BACT|nr:hypothetical protein NC99_39810 [Sunxiuqinia dokdonensis]